MLYNCTNVVWLGPIRFEGLLKMGHLCFGGGDRFVRHACCVPYALQSCQRVHERKAVIHV